jgi:phosphoserine phosphatase
MQSTLTSPLDAIIFDCDGTLSHIEGIDELAKMNGVGAQVIELTAKAMGQSGMNPEIYEQRLQLVQPKAKQLATLGQIYFDQRAPNLLETLNILKAFDKKIYIVSAGLYPAVKDFGELLEIDHRNIFAVNINFDAAGNYQDFDRLSPMIFADGKRWIVEEIKKQHPRVAFVGDGLTDLATQDVVTRFIGYGGAYYRKNIQQFCEFYITEASMLPLIPLCLTESELALSKAGDNIVI